MKAAEYPYFDVPFAAYAHRGGAMYPPNRNRENSMFAFRQAVAMGYRYLETDVHATADGVLLAFHDDELGRVTASQGAVGALEYAAVAEARIHGVDPIPRFSELLEEFPEARFNVDAKSAAAVALLADAIERHAAQARVCVSSFSLRRLHALRRRLGPSVASAVSPAGIAAHRFAPWLTRALDSPAQALQIPITHPLLGRTVTVLTPALIRSAHRAGKRVQVWTVDDADTMTEVIDAGVDGIFTDRIDVLRDVLRARGLWAA